MKGKLGEERGWKLISSFSILKIKTNSYKLAVAGYKVIQMVFLIIITKFGGTCTYKVKLVAFLENFKSLVVLVAKHSSKYLGKTGKSYTQVTVQINKDGQLEMLEVDKFQREARKKTAKHGE